MGYRQLVNADQPPWLCQLRAEVLRRIYDQNATQAALADHLGITAKHLNHVLKGVSNGSPQLLDRIAAACGLRIVVAVDGDPVPLPRGWQPKGRRRKQPPGTSSVDG